MKISFDTPGTLGDWLCLISAAREYARRHPQDQVYLPNLKDVLSLYGDDLVRFGRGDRHVVVNAAHREKLKSTRHNYLGTFLREIVPEIEEPMNLELPTFAGGRGCIVLQPYSGFATNPPHDFVQRLVDVVSECTGCKIYAVGHASTKQDLQSVDYSLIEDSVPKLLEHVARARLVLTPRSATAHIAAGYGRPTFVWVPDDGENWHLDYPGWTRELFYFKNGSDGVSAALASFI